MWILIYDLQYNYWFIRTGSLEKVGQSASRFERDIQRMSEWVFALHRKVLCYCRLKGLIKAKLPFLKNTEFFSGKKYFQRLELFSYPLREKRHFFSFISCNCIPEPGILRVFFGVFWCVYWALSKLGREEKNNRENRQFELILLDTFTECLPGWEKAGNLIKFFVYFGIIKVFEIWRLTKLEKFRNLKLRKWLNSQKYCISEINFKKFQIAEIISVIY